MMALNVTFILIMCGVTIFIATKFLACIINVFIGSSIFLLTAGSFLGAYIFLGDWNPWLRWGVIYNFQFVFK